MPRVADSSGVGGYYPIIHISKNSSPQAHIGIRMARHMFWREEFILAARLADGWGVCQAEEGGGGQGAVIWPVNSQSIR